ncbi:MAG: hypothetical protein OEQ39_12755 [Gammaproteobacteria bacterium]|nr:hypothetical protein [Gammaproteobacteria bacterium]MDH3465058.1 hypothetical protein [Gammaproteobacteria bacterium]
MDPKQEIKYLETMLKKLDVEKAGFVASKKYNSLVSTFLAILILVLIYFFDISDFEMWFLIIGALVIGVVLGILSYWKLAEQQWPMLKLHINKESVKHRLDELKNT